MLIFRIHTSGPATVQNQNLRLAYMYIYCHAEVSTLLISADRFVKNSAISHNCALLLYFGNITAMIEISLCFFGSTLPPCVVSCVIQLPKIIILCLLYTLILWYTNLNKWHLRQNRKSLVALQRTQVAQLTRWKAADDTCVTGQHVLSKQYRSQSIQLKTMYFLSCVAVFGRYTSELENWNAFVYWYQNREGGYMYSLSVPVCGEWGGGYDLNIESNII